MAITRLRKTALYLVLLALAGGIGVPAAYATAAKKKSLSLTTLTVVGPAAQSISPWWIADSKGYFAEQGITKVSYLLNGGTVASWIAVLFAGSAQFLQGNASTQVQAAAVGGPIRAIAMTSSPAGNQIFLTADAAARLHVPSSARSVKAVEAQLQALKGTHVKIAVAGTTSDSYNWIVAIGRRYGLNVGVNSPTADINVDVIASSTQFASVILTGQVDGAGGTPQTLLNVPKMLGIPIYKLPPASSSAGQYASTTISMIQQHPDLVQAVVTALTRASYFIIHNPAKALSIEQPDFVSIGFTDPAQQSLIFYTGYEDFAYLSYPNKTAYLSELALVNEAQGSNLSFPWAQFCVTRFSLTALKQLGYKVPAARTYNAG